MFAEAKYFGVGAVPGFGKEKVDDGTLYASIVAPPNAGMAIDLLHRFWAAGRPLPQRSFSEVVPYPPSRGGASGSGRRSFSHSWPANTLTLEPWCPQAAQAAFAPPSHSRSPPHFAHR